MPDLNGMKLKTEKLPLGPDWLAAVFARISDAVIAGDEEGLVAFMNPAAERLTGWTTSEALGQPFEAIVQIFDKISGQAVVIPTARTLPQPSQTGWENSRYLISKQGTKKVIVQTAIPMRDDGEQNGGVLFVFREVPPSQDA